MPSGEGFDEQQTESYWFPPALARFYLPLPDPAPIRDGYTYIHSVPILPWSEESLRASDDMVRVAGSMWLQRLHTEASTFVLVDNEAAPEPGVEAASRPPDEEYEPLPGVHGFVSTLRLWNGSQLGVMFPSVKQMIDTIRRAENLLSDSPVTGSISDELLEQELDYTVAEVVVPFMGDPSDSFDAAIHAVRHVQHSLYLVRRYPFRLITKELCPPSTIYETGIVVSDAPRLGYPVNSWVKQVMILRQDPWDWGRPSMLADDEYLSLNEALWSRLTGGAFESYMELHREAIVALKRQGDYRASVVWSAAAAEALFEELMRLLMWERGQEPESCLEPFRIQSISARVKRHFPTLLGQSNDWDLETPGAVTTWKVKVADLRNRVIHDAYFPKYTEAYDAITTIENLVKRLGDLLVADLKRHFRTAFKLLSFKGLNSRGVWDDFLRLDQAVIGLPDWVATYTRWRAAHKRLLGPARTPKTTEAIVLLIYGRKSRGYWVLCDHNTHLAARIDIDESSLGDLRPVIVGLLDGPEIEEEPRAVTFRIDTVTYTRIRTPWREEYHLLPMEGVKVRGGDVKDKEFTWAPKA